MTTSGTQRDSEFLAQAGMIRATAYRMLGTMSDAEDVVQDSYLRWQASGGEVDNPGGFLRKVAINLCLDRLRASRNSRIHYVGPWLPEPYYEPGVSRGLEDPQDLLTGLSTAFMLVLEKLTPLQRAVYLLKQIIGLSHQEIAELLEISVTSSRAHHSRAQRALQPGEEPRYEVDPDEHRRILEQFMVAVSNGDVDALESLLASDVTCYSDGGGIVAAASKPFSGVRAVIRFMLGTAKLHPPGAIPRIIPVNGSYGIFLCDDLGDSLLTVECDNGKLKELFIQRNPEKLKILKRNLAPQTVVDSDLSHSK